MTRGTKAIVIISSWGGVLLVAALGLFAASACAERDRIHDELVITSRRANECQLREIEDYAKSHHATILAPAPWTHDVP